MKSAPSYIISALKRYDRDLRLRFSKAKSVFVLERKCERRLLLPPVSFYTDENGKAKERIMPETSDAYVQFHDGYTQVLEVRKPTLRLIFELWMNDSKRMGKAFLKRMEDAYLAEEERKKNKRLESFMDRAGDVHDSLAWRQGSRISGMGM